MRDLCVLLLAFLAIPSTYAADTFESCRHLRHWQQCVAVPMASSAEDQQAKLFQPTQGTARIYLVRPGMVASKIATDVFIDGVPVGRLAPATYLAIDLPAGRHRIRTHIGDDAEIEVESNPGHLVFMEQRLVYFLGSTSSALRLLDEGNGREEVMTAKLVQTAHATEKGSDAAPPNRRVDSASH